jgi:hypothetical protein
MKRIPKDVVEQISLFFLDIINTTVQTTMKEGSSKMISLAKSKQNK